MEKEDMPDFNPAPHERIVIGRLTYHVMPHPAVPSFAFGQEGRKAFVYQLSGGPDGGLYALKKFKQAFRLAELVGICDQLARFAQWQGLEVANRTCLHRPDHGDVLDQYPDLEFAVLMPWISGTTWYDMVIGMTPLTKLEALTFAKATAQVLAAIEEAGLAHCDVSASNVIINPNANPVRAHLIDIEDLYAPGFTPPAALPAGTDGYAHKTAGNGLWGPEADRFAGAVLMAEMAAWHDPRIRKEAEDEHYFSPQEMQQDSPRYRLMRSVLNDLDPRLADLFDRAWFSETLAECPRLAEWQEVINAVHHRIEVAGVVVEWKPLSVPGVEVPEAAPRPIAPQEAPPQPSAPVPVPQEMPPAPQVVTRPAPSTPVIQPTLPPAPPPSVPPAPLHIQPPQQAGGPVREWRPLIVPPSAPVESPVLERIPIWTPPAEPPTPSPAEDAPPVEEGAAPAAPSARGLRGPKLRLSHVDERNRPHLEWTGSPGATHYLLQEDSDPNFPAPKEYRIKAGETRWSPGLLWRRSGRLHYRVRAEAGNTAGPWSETLDVWLGKA